MNQSRASILLLFGGESSEHDVSIKSAKNVAASIDQDRYELLLCYISKDGTTWKLVDSFDRLDGPILQPILGAKSFTAGDRTMHIDVMVPILHGKHGEDGEVQGLASLLHIPCVGPSLIGAAVSMDKDLTKRLIRDAGIPVVDWRVWSVDEPTPSYEEISESLGETLFVKPSNAGSSVGVSKVTTAAEYEPALKLASKHDTMVLIERAVSGREIELAVLGNRDSMVSTPGEVIAEDSFYSYDAKYAAASQAHVEIPASLDSTVAVTLQDYAKTAYAAVRGQGMARIDFFVTTANEIYLNEINSIPGFTDISMYPKMWQHDGLSYTDLISKLIDLAIERSA